MQWKMTSKHKVQNVTEGEIRGKLRGNLECGPAQPSLFLFLSECIVGGYFLSIKTEIKLVKKTSFIDIYKGKLITMFVDISLVLSGFGFQVVT